MDEFYSENNILGAASLKLASNLALDKLEAQLLEDTEKLVSILLDHEMNFKIVKAEQVLRKKQKKELEEAEKAAKKPAGKFVWIANSANFRPFDDKVKGKLRLSGDDVAFDPEPECQTGNFCTAKRNLPTVVRNLLNEGCDLYFSTRKFSTTISYFLFRPAT